MLPLSRNVLPCCVPKSVKSAPCLCSPAQPSRTPCLTSSLPRGGSLPGPSGPRGCVDANVAAAPPRQNLRRLLPPGQDRVQTSCCSPCRFMQHPGPGCGCQGPSTVRLPGKARSPHPASRPGVRTRPRQHILRTAAGNEHRSSDRSWRFSSRAQPNPKGAVQRPHGVTGLLYKASAGLTHHTEMVSSLVTLTNA